MQVHLVDGTYELFRAFFAVPSSIDASGREVGAVRALERSLRFMLRAPEVTHVGVAFDHVIESVRNTMYAGYKTGDGIDPALSSQFHPAEDAVRAMGLVVWPMVEYEADDAIATMASRAANDPRVERVVIASPDKDLAQCVRGTRVVMWDRRREIVLDEDGVRAKYGVAPAQIADLLALVGDAADGYPGIPGFGAKTAQALLAAFGSIDAIPERPSAWPKTVRGAPRLAATLAERRAEVELYRRLATLFTDVPLSESVNDLAVAGASRG